MGFAAGGFLGLLGGVLSGHPVLGVILGVAVVGLGSYAVSEMAGEAATIIYNPSGSSTPHGEHYSQAEALAVRGHYEDAVAAYQALISERPDNPETYVRIARLLRDKMGGAEDAADWFRRALATKPAVGVELAIVRELVELYRHKLGAPGKAVPLLARIAERFEGRPEGEWASNELTDVRRRMAAENEI